MAQASSAGSYVYEGIWINWTRGSTLGLTLTLSPKNASILSPALAIIISVAGSQLWRLVQIALHQTRATPKPRPMIYHQTQVTLRNASTDINALWQLIRLGVAWNQLFPVLGLALWTLVHFSSVLAFGLMSSWLLQSNDEVLSKSPWCGYFNQTYLDTAYALNYSDPVRTAIVTEYNEHFNQRYAFVQQHVDICDDSTISCSINQYRPHKLNWTSSYEANACPFNGSICHPNAGTMSMDTGFLSSHSDLGINAAKEDRVSFRMLAKCAPLDSANHSSLWQNASTSQGIKLLADASYGKSYYNSRNSTYTMWWKPLDCEQRISTPPYVLMSHYAVPGGSVATGSNSFDPIPELRPFDTDVSLMTLAFNDAYLKSVDDPWFSAMQATNDSKAYCALGNSTVYVRERPLTAIACTQQWQICNTDKDGAGYTSCAAPMYLYQAYNQLMSSTLNITLSPRQSAILYRIFSAGTKSTFFSVVRALAQAGSLPLKARSQLNPTSGGESPELPADQWQKETKYWMDLALGYLQQKSLDLSTGQFAASTANINVSKPSVDHSNPGLDANHWLCQSQIISSDTYRNFNFCALLITLILCTLVIILGLSIEDCVACCRVRRLKYSGLPGGSKQDMWIANSDIHMLRTIDALKNGTNWTLSRNGVPRTHPTYQVSINDLVVEGHDIEEGKGIVSPAVKRMQSSQSNTSHRWALIGNNIDSVSSLPRLQTDFGTPTYLSNEKGLFYYNHNATPDSLDVDTNQSVSRNAADGYNSQNSTPLTFTNSISYSADVVQDTRSPYKKAWSNCSKSSLPDSMTVRMRVDELMRGTSPGGSYSIH